MCIKINRKVAFLSSTAGRNSLNIVVIHPSTPLFFVAPFFKTFVTHPPKINELDTVVTRPCPPTLTTPQNLERALVRTSGNQALVSTKSNGSIPTQTDLMFSIVTKNSTIFKMFTA